MRDTSSTPDNLERKVVVPEGTISRYRIPAVKTSRYGKEELMRKGLEILLPFYAVRYEKRGLAGKRMRPSYRHRIIHNENRVLYFPGEKK